MKKENRDILKNLGLVTQLGISIAAPIFLSMFIGQFIDRLVKTESIFTIIFIVLGAGAGFLNIFKITGAWDDKRK